MVNRMSMVVEEAVRFNIRTPIKKIFTQMELRILLCWNIVGAAIAPLRHLCKHLWREMVLKKIRIGKIIVLNL